MNWVEVRGSRGSNLDAAEFVELACAGLGIDTESLAGRTQRPEDNDVASACSDGWDREVGPTGREARGHSRQTPGRGQPMGTCGRGEEIIGPEFARSLDRLDATLAESCHLQAKIV